VKLAIIIISVAVYIPFFLPARPRLSRHHPAKRIGQIYTGHYIDATDTYQHEWS
jgi:hypothetical protein